MAPPPLHPRHIYLDSAHISTSRLGLRRIGSLCPPGFAPHYVAVQPGRCRRFIGTLLARIKYAARTLRVGAKDKKKRRDQRHAADLGNDNAILRETNSSSISWKKLR